MGANPIVAGPEIVELYRDGDEWQITLYNVAVDEFNLDNCAISIDSCFSEFNDGIGFYEYATVSNQDLQNPLSINWNEGLILTYYNDGNVLMEAYYFSFAPNSNWSHSVNPLYNGQSLKRTEPMWEFDFIVKDSNITGGLRTKGILEGYVYDINANPIQDAKIMFYRTIPALTSLFMPVFSDDSGYFSSESYAKNYDASVLMNNQVLIDTFLTVEPDSVTTVNFYTNYDPANSDDHEIELPSSYYQLSNFPNPFNPTTEISFNVTQTSLFATIEIFNSKGQKIKTIRPSSCHPELVEGRGLMHITWNGDNENGKSCPSGVYLYKLVSGNKELAANKMLLLK